MESDVFMVESDYYVVWLLIHECEYFTFMMADELVHKKAKHEIQILTSSAKNNLSLNQCLNEKHLNDKSEL